MKITDLIEQEDGSAICQMELTNKEKEFLIEFAVVELLRRHIDEQDKKNELSGRN